MKDVLFVLLFLPFMIFGDIAVSLPANSVSNGAGVSSFGTWTSKGGFQLGWSITESGSSYNYIYSISNASEGGLSKGINSFILELNPSVTASNLSTVITKSNTAIADGPKTFTSSDISFLPGNIYGVQFDLNGSSTATISFTSTNAPVWGSFFADNGFTGGSSKGYAYNAAFGSDPNASTKDFSNWVPTVGGASVLAPEPSTMLILGSTLVAAAYIHKRRRSQKTQ